MHPFIVLLLACGAAGGGPMFRDDAAQMDYFLQRVGSIEAYRDHHGTQQASEAVQAWVQEALSALGQGGQETWVSPMVVPGCRNLGLYLVELAQTGDRFVVKRSKRAQEAIQIAAMQKRLGPYADALQQGWVHPDVGIPEGDQRFAARVVPMLYWSFSYTPGEVHGEPSHLAPIMLFEHGEGREVRMFAPPANIAHNDLTPYLQVAFNLGRSLSLLHLPHLEQRDVPLFARTTWRHGDLHMSNALYDPQTQRLNLVDCIEMRRASDWHHDIRSLLLLDRPLTDPVRQAWSRALGEGYLTYAQGTLRDELKAAFEGTLCYQLPDANSDPAIWLVTW